MFDDITNTFHSHNKISAVFDDESTFNFQIKNEIFVKEVLHTTANRPIGTADLKEIMGHKKDIKKSFIVFEKNFKNFQTLH